MFWAETQCFPTKKRPDGTDATKGHSVVKLHNYGTLEGLILKRLCVELLKVFYRKTHQWHERKTRLKITTHKSARGSLKYKLFLWPTSGRFWAKGAYGESRHWTCLPAVHRLVPKALETCSFCRMSKYRSKIHFTSKWHGKWIILIRKKKIIAATIHCT